MRGDSALLAEPTCKTKVIEGQISGDTTRNYEAELCTQQYCRINVTMFSGQQNVYFAFYFVSEATLRCCVVVVAKLKNCRVPSSVKKYEQTW